MPEFDRAADCLAAAATGVGFLHGLGNRFAGLAPTLLNPARQFFRLAFGILKVAIGKRGSFPLGLALGEFPVAFDFEFRLNGSSRLEGSSSCAVGRTAKAVPPRLGFRTLGPGGRPSSGVEPCWRGRRNLRNARADGRGSCGNGRPSRDRIRGNIDVAACWRAPGHSEAYFDGDRPLVRGSCGEVAVRFCRLKPAKIPDRVAGAFKGSGHRLRYRSEGGVAEFAVFRDGVFHDCHSDACAPCGLTSAGMHCPAGAFAASRRQGSKTGGKRRRFVRIQRHADQCRWQLGAPPTAQRQASSGWGGRGQGESQRIQRGHAHLSGGMKMRFEVWLRHVAQSARRNEFGLWGVFLLESPPCRTALEPLKEVIRFFRRHRVPARHDQTWREVPFPRRAGGTWAPDYSSAASKSSRGTVANVVAESDMA